MSKRRSHSYNALFFVAAAAVAPGAFGQQHSGDPASAPTPHRVLDLSAPTELKVPDGMFMRFPSEIARTANPVFVETGSKVLEEGSAAHEFAECAHHSAVLNGIVLPNPNALNPNVTASFSSGPLPVVGAEGEGFGGRIGIHMSDKGIKGYFTFQTPIAAKSGGQVADAAISAGIEHAVNTMAERTVLSDRTMVGCVTGLVKQAVFEP